jgi:hypothetical protein
MNNNNKPQHLFDNPANIKLVVRGLVFSCIFLVGLDFIVHRHTMHPLEEIYAFYAIYGFSACVLLVLLAKEMRKLLMRDEQYYGDETDETQQEDASND